MPITCRHRDVIFHHVSFLASGADTLHFCHILSMVACLVLSSRIWSNALAIQQCSGNFSFPPDPHFQMPVIPPLVCPSYFLLQNLRLISLCPANLSWRIFINTSLQKSFHSATAFTLKFFSDTNLDIFFTTEVFYKDLFQSICFQIVPSLNSSLCGDICPLLTLILIPTALVGMTWISRVQRPNSILTELEDDYWAFFLSFLCFYTLTNKW